MYAFKASRSEGFDGAFNAVFGKPSPARRTSAVLAGLAILLATAAAAQSPAPPVLNVPYVCANGLTYTVTKCSPWRTDQMCQYSEFQNGNHVTDAFRAYLRPLLGSDMPQAGRLRHTPVAKILKP